MHLYMYIHILKVNYAQTKTTIMIKKIPNIITISYDDTMTIDDNNRQSDCCLVYAR